MKRLSLPIAKYVALYSVLALTGLATAQPVLAYTCIEGGNPPPESLNEDLKISQMGNCTLTSVTAPRISIQIKGPGDLHVGSVTSTQGATDISASVGSIKIGSISSDSSLDVNAAGELNVTGDVISGADISLRASTVDTGGKISAGTFVEIYAPVESISVRGSISGPLIVLHHKAE